MKLQKHTLSEHAELAEGYGHEIDGWVMEIVENKRVVARMRFDGQQVH